MDEYPRGSEWRRWDLQAATVLDDNYVPLATYSSELKNASLSEWQQYVTRVGGESNALLFDSPGYFNDGSVPKKQRCVNYVRNFYAFTEVFNPALACIGLTDHNYYDDLLLDTFVDYSQKQRCKVLPGVEINCQGIHMLLYFPGVFYGKSTISATIHTFLTKFNINNRKNADGSLVTTSMDIKEILDEAGNAGAVVIYPHCNSNNGLFQERTNTDRTHLADIYNHQPINLLQSRHLQSCTVVGNYIRSNPALVSRASMHISSDARALRDYGRCDKDGNYLWIKADPTFEGLKQIIYEPEQRIHCGPERPEEKKPYFVIQSARFLDNTATVRFPSTSIPLNQNLTTIIGGKSTGKSLLLYYLAKTIDAAEVANRIDPDDAYDLDRSPDFNFEVTWNDLERTVLKPSGSGEASSSRERKILYIPQRYLNTLSETNIKSKEALNSFVLNVILQDSAMRNTYDSGKDEISAKARAIAGKVAELFAARDEVRRIDEEIRAIGDPKGIESYIESLQAEIDKIKASSGMSPEQASQYETLAGEDRTISTRIVNLDQDKRTVTQWLASANAKVGELRATTLQFSGLLNDAEAKVAFGSATVRVDDFQTELGELSRAVNASIDARLAQDRARLVAIGAEMAPLIAVVKLQTELQAKSEALRKEQDKLNEISVKTNSRKIIDESFRSFRSEALDGYREIIGKYEYLREECKKFEGRFGDIALSVGVAFNEEVFNTDIIKEYINRTDLKRAIPETEWGTEFVYRYDAQKHVTNIVRVFEGLVDNTIGTIKGRHPKDAATKLLDDLFFLDFGVFYRNDSLDKMSPGKKGLVLLQVLINLSNEEWPILLDQPEDDLDNRSVYGDLVSFLKKKKSQRQIVIVTHNPNLVVAADAEEVIVANQAGQEIGRENRKYKFEYVSGSLESSFEIPEAQERAILFRKGIREHACEILEGGIEAFRKREQQYDFPDR